MAADEANSDRCFRMFEIHKLEGINTGAAKSDRLRRKTRTRKIPVITGDDIGMWKIGTYHRAQ